MTPYRGAISAIESSGNYRALGPQTKSGDRAYGKYQIMGANIPEWTQQVLGRPMTPQEFLADDKAQDAVFDSKFGGYVSKYGPEGAARAWFAGEGGMNDPNRKDILGTSVEAYGKKFSNALGQDSMTPMQAAMAPQQPTEFSAQSRQAPPSLSSQFINNGPGALFGQQPGQSGANASTDLFTALGNAGLHLRDDVSALGALKKNQSQRDEFTTSYDPTTGTVFRLNKRTGQVDTQRNPNFTGEKVEPSVINKIGDEFGKINQVHASSQNAKRFIDAIDKGEIDLSLFAKGKVAWENTFGTASPQTQLYNDFESFRAQLTNAILIQHKGVQTEGDAQRAADQFIAGMGKFDSKSVRNALERLIDANGKLVDSTAKTTLEPYKARYNNPGVFKPFEDQLGPIRDFYKQQPKQKTDQMPLPKGVRSITIVQ